MVPWALPSLPSNRHLDRFSRFYKAHERDQQTDTQTTLLVSSNRSHLESAELRPKIVVVR